MIVARNINKSYGISKVLCGVNLHISKGSIYGLAGRSGAGKSTFLRCINGLEPYDQGELRVDGVQVKDLSSRALRVFRKNIGMIFQNFSLLERLTVYDNVALPMRCWKKKPPFIDKRVKELVGLVGLTEKINHKPRALSGGQKQRVAIARALSLEPQILLCDEATSALDPKTAQEIITLLRQINTAMGITIVMVTHQMALLSNTCQEVAILENGRVESQGPVQQIFRQQPLALKNLLGSQHRKTVQDDQTILIVIADDKALAGQIAVDLGIAVTVCGDTSHFISSGNTGLLLRLATSDFQTAAQFLDQRKIQWQIVDPVTVNWTLKRAG